MPTLLVSLSASAGAQPEIHRCTQEDGTVAFQEMPCPAPPEDDDSDGEDQSDGDAPEPADDFFDFDNPFDEPEEPPAPAEPAPPSPASRDRAECEKTARDAIDAIDLEMRKGSTKEERRRYLAELLELTQQLRACKRL